MALTKEERKALRKEGMKYVRVITTNGADRLLRGRSRFNEVLYGWLRDGESVRDIRWVYPHQGK